MAFHMTGIYQVNDRYMTNGIYIPVIWHTLSYDRYIPGIFQKYTVCRHMSGIYQVYTIIINFLGFPDVVAVTVMWAAATATSACAGSRPSLFSWTRGPVPSKLAMARLEEVERLPVTPRAPNPRHPAAQVLWYRLLLVYHRFCDIVWLWYQKLLISEGNIMAKIMSQIICFWYHMSF